jgi:hypothetical protein
MRRDVGCVAAKTSNAHLPAGTHQKARARQICGAGAVDIWRRQCSANPPRATKQHKERGAFPRVNWFGPGQQWLCQ